MPGGSDRTRRLSGATARLLPEPGEAILRRPEILDEVPADPATGRLAPPTVLDSTPLASGTTPRREREASIGAAESLIAPSTEAGADGRSPDPRRSPDEVGTGGAAVRPAEPSDPRRTDSTSTASTEAAPVSRGGEAPHFFAEQQHQVFYHDAIVYIEGEDVSPYLTGTIAVTYGFGADFNKCDFTLDNAGHRFTLTPENLQGQFRTSSPITMGGSFDYDESIKDRMYARKSDIRRNPVDPLSGGRRFPLHLWSTIFHKHDAVRVFIHNPGSERDEWIPVFTGFVLSKPVNEDYITGLNTLSVSCADIRSLMASMRVNTNSMLAVLPGSSTTDQADPTNDITISGASVWRNYSPQGNQEFNTSFFQSLVVGSSLDNPWSGLNLPELISALTFLPGTNQGLFDRGAGRTSSGLGVSATREEDSIRDTAAQIAPLRARVAASGEDSLSAGEQRRYHALLNTLAASGIRAERVDSTIAALDTDVTPTAAPAAEEEAEAHADPTPPPGGAAGSTTINPRAVGLPRGSGRIGRMRPGVFPFYQSLGDDPPRPYASETVFPSTRRVQAVQNSLSRWYSLCVFGTPIRHNFTPSPSGDPEDSAPNYSSLNRRYWTEDEVHEAGRSTRREGAWHPEAQGVHFLSPGRMTPNDPLWEYDVIQNSAVGTNLNWTNRLQLISDSCDTADYRFWVSGCGDLIFEFAQYDFSPEDYGGWAPVLTLDHHLTNESFDEEGGEVVTGVVANGSFVAHGGVSEGNIASLNPGRSVGVWSPNLASRLGLNLKVVTFAQVTDVHRIEQLATLEFQKLLAAADKYQLSLAFRPWLILNKPVFNAYRERIALIDGLSWTLPVTAGLVAGQQPPSMDVTLNYTRTYDEVGLPRYITGGPSNPMYFGIPADSGRSIHRRIAKQVRDFQRALTSLREGPLTAETFEELRNRYRAILPQGQATYNVINAAFLGAPDLPSGEEDPIVSGLRAVDAALAETSTHSGAFTEAEIASRLESISDTSEALAQDLRDRESASASTSSAPSSADAERTSAGTRPALGSSGVRSTLGPSTDFEPADPPEATEEPTCNPGDPRFYSAPTGPTVRTVPDWHEWVASVGRGPRASTVFRSYSRGQIPDETIDRGVGTFQFAGEFPRIVVSGFGQRGPRWHPGLDIPMDFGEEVYAVADGIVYLLRPNTGQGRVLGLVHAGGFTSQYNHQDHFADGIELGATVKRNQVISYCGYSGGEDRRTLTHLHFETGALAGSDIYRRYVGNEPGNEKRFRVVTQAERTASEASLDPAERQRIIASRRIVYGVGDEHAEVLSRWDPELVARFNLDFLRRRDGSAGLISRNLLHYNAIPTSDPFSQPETVGRPSGPDTDVISLESYFDQFGLKGIPALRLAVEPTRFAPVPVPEIPTGVSDRRRSRLERERASAMATNARRAERLVAYTTSRNQQVALFANEVHPNDCPPARYEGDIERQAGEPLPTRRRLTRETAEDSRRRSI